MLRPSHFDEVAPVLVAVAQVDGSGGRSEGPIRRGHRSSGSCDALAGAGGYVDDDAGLAAELGRRRAVDDFQGLHRVGGELVGENLTLLIGNGLAVDGERVGGVVAQPVEEAVRVRSNARRGKRDERAERRRLAFQRHFLEQVAVHVRVSDRIVLDQVLARRRHLHHGRGLARLQRGIHRNRNRRPHVRILRHRAEARGRDREVVRVQRQIGELVMTGVVSLGLSFVAADRVVDGDGGSLNDCAGGIGDDAIDGA